MTIEPIIGRKVILFQFNPVDLDHFIKLHREDKNGYMQNYCLKEMSEEEAKKFMTINILGGQVLIFTVMTKEGKASRRAGYIYFSDIKKDACCINGIMDKDFIRGLDKILRKEKYTYSEDTVKTAIHWLFSMFEDMERVEANVIKDNKLALHLDKKCGFKEEGVLRHYIKIDSKYHDVVILSYLRKDYENNGKI